MTPRHAGRVALALGLALGLAAGCSGNHGPTSPAGFGPARTFRMGFSAIPPRPDSADAVGAVLLWTRRADAAIFHEEPPWDSLLAGVRPDSLVLHAHRDLVNFYRGRNLLLVFTLDATNGLDRSAESPALVAAGRSLTEPAVQALYRAYAVAVDTLLHPDYLGLAAETNLIRTAASPALYAAVVQAANGAAADVGSVDPAARLYVSVQVEVAWGRFGNGAYQGISADLLDFPFLKALGLSSYPYLAGFAEPEEVPSDYYSRLAAGTLLPLLVVEGGWTSASVGSVVSSPEKQARWIRRQVQLLDGAKAVAVFQLTFTDLDLSAFPVPPGSILPLFAHLGLVDTDLATKPALAPWDSAFARRRSALGFTASAREDPSEN